MNATTKFKLTMEFEVEISPISVPDADAFQKLGTPPGAKELKKLPGEKVTRAGLKAKGLSETDIEKYLAAARQGSKDAGKGKGGKPPDYQMLIYPEYEAWAAAQRTLQQEILKDHTLSTDYVREIVRDLTRGQIDALIDDKYGAPDLNGVLKSAMKRIPASSQAILKSEEESLLLDETELVDDSVTCRFARLTVIKV